MQSNPLTPLLSVAASHSPSTLSSAPPPTPCAASSLCIKSGFVPDTGRSLEDTASFSSSMLITACVCVRACVCVCVGGGGSNRKDQHTRAPLFPASKMGAGKKTAMCKQNAQQPTYRTQPPHPSEWQAAVALSRRLCCRTRAALCTCTPAAAPPSPSLCTSGKAGEHKSKKKEGMHTRQLM